MTDRKADVARIQALVDEGSINDKLARQVFDGVLAGEGTADEVVASRGLAIVSDDGALSEAVDVVLDDCILYHRQLGIDLLRFLLAYLNFLLSGDTARGQQTGSD